MSNKQLIKRVRDNDRTLTELNLNKADITVDELRFLADALSRNKYVKICDFSNNFIGPDNAKILAEGLQKNTALHTLYLRSNEIGDAGAIAFAEVLKGNDTMRNIYFGNNEITAIGVSAIADILSLNCGLEILSFRNNDVTDEGCEALKKNLEINSSLKTLNLANTQITDQAVSLFIEALEINTNVVDINVNYNEIDDEEILEELQACLKYNNSQNVQSVNKVARKILTYCEEELTQQEMGDLRAISQSELAQKYALGREDLYYLSNRNKHGGAILCVTSLYRMALDKYDREIVDVIFKAAGEFCGTLFSCLREELKNPDIEKPHNKIVGIASGVLERVAV